MNFPIHLTREALQEEAEAYLFYEAEQSGLGERFLKQVEIALKKVLHNPTHYSFCDETKTIRDIRLIRFPFIIIYEIRSNKIVVYHIHHTRKESK